MGNEALYNSNDSTTGRDGGPYLDVHQAEQSEVNRARIEDREPDFENLPANAGIQLNRAGQQMRTEPVNNLPSQDGRTGIGYSAVGSMDALVKDEDVLLKPWTEVDDDALTDDDVEPVVTKSDDFVADGSTDVGADNADEVKDVDQAPDHAPEVANEGTATSDNDKIF